MNLVVRKPDSLAPGIEREEQVQQPVRGFVFAWPGQDDVRRIPEQDLIRPEEAAAMLLVLCRRRCSPSELRTVLMVAPGVASPSSSPTMAICAFLARTRVDVIGRVPEGVSG